MNVMNVTSGGYDGPIGAREPITGDFPLKPMSGDDWFKFRVNQAQMNNASI